MNKSGHTYISLIIVLSIFVSSFTIVNAQEDKPLKDKLTLLECREMALENNLKLKIAQEQVKAAEYKTAAYKTNYLPKLSATGLFLYSDATLDENIEGGYLPTFIPDGQGNMIQNDAFAYLPDIPLELKVGGTYNAALQVEQPIYMGGKINAAYQMAKKGQEMTQVKEKLSAVELSILSDKAYWNTVKVKALITSANQYKATLEELHRMVKNAVDAGMRHRKDLLTVQVKLNEAELNLTRAKNGYRLAIMNLNHIIGLPLNNETEIADSFTNETDPSISADLLKDFNEFDVSSRPEHHLLSKQIELKEHQEKLTRSDFLPNVGVKAMYGYTNGLKLNDETMLDDANFTALLSVNIPIFNWGEGRNKLKEAKVERSIAQMQLENAQEEMTLEVTKAFNNLQEALLEITLSSKSVEQAEQNMKISKDRYKAGMETLANYMETQTIWQKAMSDLIAAKATYQLSRTEYLKAVGKL